MAVQPRQFEQRLIDSGLIPAAELGELLDALPPDRKADAEQLAGELVRQRKLTAYQAQEIYQGRGGQLVLGNYVVLDKLGQGGMGLVFKAEHRRMERVVALKVLSPDVTSSPEAVARFQREVKAAARLEHPHIVTAYDADQAGTTHFLVMQYVEGTDLSALVKQKGPLSLDKALHCVIQAARGLEYAHGRGVVHRDIKPANLLLDRDGTVKILDMGLARLESAGANQDELTGSGQIMGTVDYMAPEQAMDTRQADGRADIYSLGITLWYLLTGRPAYEAPSTMAKLLAHRDRPIPSIHNACPSAPSSLDAVFARMAAKTPESRYQTMTEVIADLERCRGAEATPPSIASAPGEDSRLNEFLRGLEQSEAGRPHATGRGLAPGNRQPVTGRPTTRPAATGETMTNLSLGGDTDPSTDQALGTYRAALLARGRAGSARLNWLPFPATPRNLSLAGSATAVLLLLGVIFLWWANRGTARVAEGDPLLTGVGTPGATSSVAGSKPSVARPPRGGSSSPTGGDGQSGDEPKIAWRRLPPGAPDPAIAPFDAKQAQAFQQAWASFLDVAPEETNTIGMRLRLIPPGEFWMGSTDQEVEAHLATLEEDWVMIDVQSEAPRHRARITRPFWMAVHEVTVGQFRAFVEATGYQTEAEQSGGALVWSNEARDFLRDPERSWRDPGFPQSDDHPVVSVSWNDAVAFCQWLSRKEAYMYRLPTEAEWEYACRAGTETAFAFGKELGPKRARIDAGLPDTVPVGGFRDNAFGLRDMHGNTSEWCADFFHPDWYRQSPRDDPAGPEQGDGRVGRGGAAGYASRLARSAYRHSARPDFSVFDMGFRVARGGPTPDRAVARWIHASGGVVGIASAGVPFVDIYPDDALPAEHFSLITTALGEGQVIDDELRWFDGLSRFSTLILNGAGITDAGLELLGEMPELQKVYIGDNRITQRGLNALLRYPKMTHMHVNSLTDDAMSTLARFENLEQLWMVNCPVSDQGLVELEKLRKLKDLNLFGTLATPAGVDRLRQALPDCRVETSFGVFDPASTDTVPADQPQ